ncbi:MAG: hypothetical protein HY537_07350 [Deltaproteobacteria bacterium]|nr:hypothetical protein [Deltaproteobacteria bacterium]
MAPNKDNASDARKKLADYALVIDLLGKLSGAASEQTLAEDIFHLFEMLYGPFRWAAYLPVVETQPGEIKVRGILDDNASMAARMLDLKTEYSWTPSRKGFLLRIEREGALLAIVAVEDFLLVDHIEHYLNLALNLTPILGLAVSNARVYQRLRNEISERQRSEQALQQTTHALARSNKELEQFAYLASHDLQEPLRMISNYVSLLKMRYAGKLDQDADEFIEYAVDGAKRMQALINSILEYSRVGKAALKPEPVDLTDVIKESLSNLRVSVEESDAVIKMDTLPTVMGNRERLVLLFQNLIGNAIKYRKKEEAPMIYVSGKEDGSRWELSIKDNGIGIDESSTDRIFMLFQRLHGKSEYPGSGVGLAICKKIVEQHGGRIWVESKPGEGSTFRFTLPSP